MSDLKRHLRRKFIADFNGGYVFTADESGKPGLMFASIRGWGQLQYEQDAEATQDEHLRFLVDALNEKVERENK